MGAKQARTCDRFQILRSLPREYSQIPRSTRQNGQTMNDQSLSTSPAARDAAERAGYAALLAGHGFAVNPHRISTHRVECIAWGRGWAAVRTDLKREKAKLR